jgi:hypothetical protein
MVMTERKTFNKLRRITKEEALKISDGEPDAYLIEQKNALLRNTGWEWKYIWESVSVVLRGQKIDYPGKFNVTKELIEVDNFDD